MPDGARRGRHLAAATAFALVALTAAPVATGAAAAEEVTAATLRELAARAEHDPAARNELAKVRRVDGRPADVGIALRGGTEEEQRARLRTLARAGGGAPAPDAAAARDDARRILESRRFKPAETPRPFRGVLRKLAEWLRPVTRPLGRLWLNITQPRWGTALPAAAVLVLCVVVALRMVRRRTEAALGGGGDGGRHRRHDLDPDALERQAATAEADGDYDTALRLRFRAGLLRLDAVGAVKLRPSLTTGELTRRVRSDDLQELAAAFEAVAYAGEHADATDVEAARSRWPRVLAEAGRR